MPEGEEVLRALDAIHEMHAQRGTCACLLCSYAPAEALCQQRDADPRHRQERQRGPGQHRVEERENPGSEDGKHARDEERPNHAQIHMLQLIYVRDQACQEVAAAVAQHLIWSQAYEAAIDPHAQLRQQAKGDVMADQALRVTRAGPRHASEPHDVDGQREGHQQRSQHRVRDQVGCHAEQPGVACDHDDTKYHGEDDAPAGWREQTQKRGKRSHPGTSTRLPPPPAATNPAYVPPSRSSSSCVPMATTRPCSNTMICSAKTIVFSRWATTNSVRSRASAPIACRISASLSGSREDVGSSRISSGASLRNALAIAKRWACPALRPVPRSPSRVSSPSGSAATTSTRPAHAQAFRSCASPAAGRAGSKFSRRRPANRYGRWGTSATCVRHCSGGNFTRG